MISLYELQIPGSRTDRLALGVLVKYFTVRKFADIPHGDGMSLLGLDAGADFPFLNLDTAFEDFYSTDILCLLVVFSVALQFFLFFLLGLLLLPRSGGNGLATFSLELLIELLLRAFREGFGFYCVRFTRALQGRR
jgi:hypothetical protein